MAGPNTVQFSSTSGHTGVKATARITCPWCGVFVSGEARSVTFAHRMRNGNHESSLTFVCNDPACGRSSLLGFENPSGSVGLYFDYEVSVHPSRRSTYAPDGVPADLARDFREALDSRAAGFLYGAAVVGRRVLQAAVRSLVGERRDLRAEIDALTSDQVPKPLRDAAHEVRFTGNDAAHADEVTEAECDDLLAFTERILDQIYVMPAQVAAAAARRANKP